MKKILLTAAAIASMLFAASCQKENFSARQEGDVVTATLTVQAPGQPGTKVIGDGMTADNLVFAVFDETGVELPELRQGDWIKEQEEITFGGDLQTTVTVKLVRGKEYTFVCWAQNKDAKCYDFTDMKNIGVSYKDAASQDETRDAFFAGVPTGKITEDFSQTITLKRPFAQINVGTTDLIEAEKAGLEIDNLYSTMTVKNAATVLHTFTGAASAAEEVTFAYAHSVPVEKLVINKDKVVNNPTVAIADKYDWLAMNYILVADGTTNGASSALAEVTFSIRENDATVLTSYDVPNVPVHRNYRTNIVGGLLTADGEVSIIIDPVFEGEYVVGNEGLVIEKETTVETVMKNLGFANAAVVKTVTMDEIVTVTFAQGKASNAPAYYTSGEAVRLYQNGATMTVSANGKTIKAIEIAFSQNHYYIAADSGEFSAEGEVRTWTGAATEVKFTTTGTDKNHRAYVSKIKVTYE